MKCPKCSQEMVGGSICLKGSFIDILLLGLGGSDLHFNPDHGDPAIELWGGKVVRGFKCSECSVLVIDHKAKL